MIQFGTEWLESILNSESVDSQNSNTITTDGDPVMGVSTDSRTIQSGFIFFAIAGDRHDGHQHVESALQKGASRIIVNESFQSPSSECESKLIRVKDTRRALGVLAHGIRIHFKGLVIGVAGSNGKTSVKDLIHDILSGHIRVLKSPASFNNDIGVPLTIFQLIEKECDCLVMELGTNHPGELNYLCRIARPDIGVLTSIGPEHLEFFENIEGVIEEESYIARLLPNKGRFYFNGDCEYSQRIAKMTEAQPCSVGNHSSNHFVLRLLELSLKRTTFLIESQESEKSWTIPTPLLGEHNILNCGLAFAIAHSISIPDDHIVNKLQAASASPRRMEYRKSHGRNIIHDYYNANPGSTNAAFQWLDSVQSPGKKMILLGEHAEAGNQIGIFYQSLIDRFHHSSLEYIAFFGRHFLHQNHFALKESLSDRILYFDEGDALSHWIHTYLNRGDTVLIKGSRIARLENVVEKIENQSPQQF